MKLVKLLSKLELQFSEGFERCSFEIDQYGDDVKMELREIYERIYQLWHKLNIEDYYGSFSYNDKGVYDGFLDAVSDYKHKVIEMAGIEIDEPLSLDASYTAAVTKLCQKGKGEEVRKLKETMLTKFWTEDAVEIANRWDKDRKLETT
ncbi:MAG: hypothetical protein QM737_22735 [Ferruginibacter sp.]